MQKLPAALAPLAAYDQFILWKPVPRPDGRIDKVPLDPRTGHAADPHVPANWMSATVAIERAAATGTGVGFTFTAEDPFFFLDIDHCRDGDTWKPIVHTLLAALPGVGVEVSQSGDGLHLFGRGAAPGHGTRNVPHGLELYTTLRFVALTGIHAAGDAGADLGPHLDAVAAEYFKPTTGGGPVEGWTSEPVPEWRGPEDDEELIKRALRAKPSATSVFGKGVTFKDLWTANEEALAARWPDDKRPYNASHADASLAQMLAFWTGANCDRIYTLMWQSELKRSKWEREDYLIRTITNAVEKQTTFYKERQKIERAVASVDEPKISAGYQYLGADAQMERFEGCVYVQGLHRVFAPNGALLKAEQFNATFGGYVFQLDETGSKTTRKAWEAFTESQLVKYPQAETICFRPELPPGAIVVEESRKLVNTYVPIETPRLQGDPAPFLAHLGKMFPDARDQQILLAYMAACIQHKGTKFQWAPLVQGVEGNGKSLLTHCVAFAVGWRYTHLPQALDIDNKFNAWVSGKLFAGVEDIYTPDKKREVLEALKPLITGMKLGIQPKGVDQFTGDNRANFMLNSNHRDAIKKTRNDRRFAVFFGAQQEHSDLARDGMSGKYFPELYGWLKGDGYAIVADYLETYPIPDDLNPATNCHRAPKTSSTDAAIFASLGSIEQEIMEAIDEGKNGFARGWISSMALQRMLVERRKESAIPPNKRREVLQSLGYDWHPALPGGRTSTHVMEEGGKPRLFIKAGNPSAAITLQGDVISAYLAAQKGPDALAVDGLIAKM